MNNLKKITIAVALLVCMVMALSVTAFAAETQTKLTVEFQSQYKDYLLSDVAVNVKLYKIADLSEPDGKLTKTTKFEDVDLTKSAADIKSAADNIVSLDASGVSYNKDMNTSTGKAVFEGIDNGVYLVIVNPYQDLGKNYTYNISSTYVSVPAISNTEWNYDVTAELKGSKTDEKDTYKIIVEWPNDKKPAELPEKVHIELNNGIEETETDITGPDWKGEFKGPKNTKWNVSPESVEGYKPVIRQEGNVIYVTYEPIGGETIEVIIDGPDPEEEIPNTGLLWWPVAILAVAGILFVTYGTLRRKSNKNEE